MRKMKVPFDAKMINSIMNEERGAALRILFQIKLALDKESNQFSTTGLKKSVVDKKWDVEATKTQLKGTLGGGGLSSMNKSNKLKPIEDQLLRFKEKGKVLEEKAKHEAKAE